MEDEEESSEEEDSDEEEEDENNGSSVADVDKVTAEDGVVDSDEASNLPGNYYHGLGTARSVFFLVTKWPSLLSEP